MSYSDDLSAINTYFRTQVIPPLPNGQVNAEAFQIKDAFVRWYDNLGPIDRNFTGQEVYDEARTRRNQFSLAMAPTPAHKEELKDQLASGASTEEMQGKDKPAYDRATGRVGTQVKKPTVAPTPSAMPDSNTPNTGVKRQLLTVGTRGPDVEVWQKFVGISPVTGYYGEVTAAKTKVWQQGWNNSHPADKITVDGKVGDATWTRAFPGSNEAPSPFAPEPPKPNAGGFAPAPPQPKPLGPTPPPAPAPHKSGTASAQKPKASATKPKVVAAGIFNIASWPLWAKVGAGLTVLGGIAAAFGGESKKPRRYLGTGED
jgi:peptidoglycan hydrolase-like protein with peptidoglycan-binding domain